VNLGLSKLGYQYVTIDCGWTVPYRVDGSLTWNATLFPHGIPALSSFIHNLGLKFGMYEDGGVQTCGGSLAQAGSLGEHLQTPYFDSARCNQPLMRHNYKIRQ
jgi:alpha-galactosidase